MMNFSPGSASRYVPIARFIAVTERANSYQARCCIAVFELPLGTDVEIEVSAYVDAKERL